MTDPKGKAAGGRQRATAHELERYAACSPRGQGDEKSSAMRDLMALTERPE